MPVDPRIGKPPTRFSIACRVREIVAQALPWKQQETLKDNPHDALAKLSECRVAAGGNAEVLGELESLISAARNEYEAEFAIVGWANVAVRDAPDVIDDISEWCLTIAPINEVHDDAQIAPNLRMKDFPSEENAEIANKMINECRKFGIYHDLAIPQKGPISRRELTILAHHLSAAAVKVIREVEQEPQAARPTIVSPVIAPESFPAEHYKAKFGIQPDTLKKAQQRKRIRAEKRNGRWFYPVDEVRRLYPDAFADEDKTG